MSRRKSRRTRTRALDLEGGQTTNKRYAAGTRHEHQKLHSLFLVERLHTPPKVNNHGRVRVVASFVLDRRFQHGRKVSNRHGTSDDDELQFLWSVKTQRKTVRHDLFETPGKRIELWPDAVHETVLDVELPM